MTDTNYYCAGSHCRKTTRRVRVRMSNQTYFYCVECGRRLETREESHVHEKKAGRAG